MPRTPLTRTTFVFAASSSLFSTLAFAGYVPIGAADVVPDGATSDAPALIGEVVTENQPLAFGFNARTIDESGLYAVDANAPAGDPSTRGRIRTNVAEGMYRGSVFDGPVAVPLPGAVYTTLVGLAGVAWLKRRGIKG